MLAASALLVNEAHQFLLRSLSPACHAVPAQDGLMLRVRAAPLRRTHCQPDAEAASAAERSGLVAAQGGNFPSAPDHLPPEDVLERHQTEASCAIAYRKDAVLGASQRFNDLSKMFAKAICVEPTDAQQSVHELSTQEDLVSPASKDWFGVSSDYQQDKSVPSWNR